MDEGDKMLFQYKGTKEEIEEISNRSFPSETDKILWQSGREERMKKRKLSKWISNHC